MIRYTHPAHLDQWRDLLATALRFVGNCADAYQRAPDRLRKFYNAAVFTRITVRQGRVERLGPSPAARRLLSTSRFEYGNMGGAEGNRTPDLLDATEALYQLSYSPLRGDSLAPPRRGQTRPRDGEGTRLRRATASATSSGRTNRRYSGSTRNQSSGPCRVRSRRSTQ